MAIRLLEHLPRPLAEGIVWIWAVCAAARDLWQGIAIEHYPACCVAAFARDTLTRAPVPPAQARGSIHRGQQTYVPCRRHALNASDDA